MENQNLIQGQIEAIMPRFLAAREAAEKSKKELDDIKKEILDIIPKPMTINTTWGKLIRKKGSRTVKITCRALKAKITAMKEAAVKKGEAEENFSSDCIDFRGS